MPLGSRTPRAIVAKTTFWFFIGTPSFFAKIGITKDKVDALAKQ
jgi:hypothetical protein